MSLYKPNKNPIVRGNRGGNLPSYSDYSNPSSPLKIDSFQQLLSYDSKTAKERIVKIRLATERVKAGTRVAAALTDFCDAWEEFLKEVMRLRAALARCEITRARYDSQTRLLANKLAKAFASIKESEANSMEVLPSSAAALRDRADG